MGIFHGTRSLVGTVSFPNASWVRRELVRTRLQNHEGKEDKEKTDDQHTP